MTLTWMVIIDYWATWTMTIVCKYAGVFCFFAFLLLLLLLHSQLDLWGSPFFCVFFFGGVDICICDFYNPTIEVGLFCLHSLFVCWLLNVPATGECISGTDLLRQLYVLPHWDRSCRSNVLPHPVTVYWHRADQSQYWPCNARLLAG